ncbi:MAG TPA: hypothetical protein VN363_05910 [Anaerolineales bacterium]|nr:hypothetical protein [Anaerolineales bacterium]
MSLKNAPMLTLTEEEDPPGGVVGRQRRAACVIQKTPLYAQAIGVSPEVSHGIPGSEKSQDGSRQPDHRRLRPDWPGK